KWIISLSGLILAVLCVIFFTKPGAVAAAGDMTIKNGVLTRYSVRNGATSVVIPDKVTAIADEAFMNDSTLEEVTIPTTVTKIGARSFYNCTALKTLTIPDSVSSIGESCFSNCKSLTKVNIGYSLRTIGDGAFAGNTSLKEFDISGKNSYLFTNDGMLYDKNSTILICYAAGREDAKYVMPFSVEQIRPYAFWGTEHLKYLRISNSVGVLTPLSIANAKALEAVFLPNSVTAIRQYAFRDDYNLRLIAAETPDIIEVDPSAYYGCASNIKMYKMGGKVDLEKTVAQMELVKDASGNSIIKVSKDKKLQAIQEVEESKEDKDTGSSASSDSASSNAVSADGTQKSLNTTNTQTALNKGEGRIRNGRAYINTEDDMATSDFDRTNPGGTIGSGKIAGGSAFIMPSK
ncbi:MAG: leucine-rich repeat domain-containing protein, partial [Lachnospiraceae bacterium]|nr:leucine-rich repeat domain-containing protein [Lachnospiraceae bacterium]